MFSISRTESLKAIDCFIPVLAEFLIISYKNENEAVRDRNAVINGSLFLTTSFWGKKLTVDRNFTKQFWKLWNYMIKDLNTSHAIVKTESLPHSLFSMASSRAKVYWTHNKKSNRNYKPPFNPGDFLANREHSSMLIKH